MVKYTIYRQQHDNTLIAVAYHFQNSNLAPTNWDFWATFVDYEILGA